VTGSLVNITCTALQIRIAGVVPELAFHQPNGSPDERAVFLDFDDMLNNTL
jgi:hypothetical protein